MPKKIELKSKTITRFPTPVDVEYGLEYLRIDGRRIGSRIVDTVVGAQQPLVEDTRHVSLTVDDLPAEAQDAFETLMDAILDYACDCPDGKNDDLLEVNDPTRYAEKLAAKAAEDE